MGDNFNRDEVSIVGVQMDLFLLRVGKKFWKLEFVFNELFIIMFDYNIVQLVVRQLLGGYDELEKIFSKFVVFDVYDEKFEIK